MGIILIKSTSDALKIEVFKKKFVLVAKFFIIDVFLKTVFSKALKALFTKIVFIFCQLILEVC